MVGGAGWVVVSGGGGGGGGGVFVVVVAERMEMLRCTLHAALTANLPRSRQSLP